MTMQEFDGLLPAGLAAAAEWELEAAWTAQGPAPACSAGHLAWQESFLADPLRLARKAQRRASPLRRAARLALIAALAAALLVGCAVALVPGFRQYWTIWTEQIITQYTGEVKDYYHYDFDGNTFLLEYSPEELGGEAELSFWYPQWLPELPEHRFYQIDQDFLGLISYETRSSLPEEDPYTYGQIFLSYELLQNGTYSYGVIGSGDTFMPRLEETSVKGYPAFFLYLYSDSTLPDSLIWFNFDEQIVFRVYGDINGTGYTESQLIQVAEHVGKEKYLP